MFGGYLDSGRSVAKSKILPDWSKLNGQYNQLEIIDYKSLEALPKNAFKNFSGMTTLRIHGSRSLAVNVSLEGLNSVAWSCGTLVSVRCHNSTQQSLQLLALNRIMHFLSTCFVKPVLRMTKMMGKP